MAGEPIGHVTVESCRDRRFKLEQLLALDLVYEFTSDKDLIGPLRQMAKAAIAEVRDLAKENWQYQAGVRQAFREESALAMWRKTDKNWSGSRFKDLGALAGDAHLSVFDISDIIRLYGAIVEKSGATGLSYAKKWSEDKESYRRGIGSGFGHVDKGTLWGKDLSKGGRRFRGDPSDPRSVSTTPQGRGLRSWQVPDFNPPRRGGTLSKRGIDFKQATGKSTVRKIEDLFGLPVGADISGTTADSIYFIHRFCEICGIPYDPIYQLLALASLVRARHHALIEPALTMSSFGIVDYHIGFYETLNPKYTKHPAAGKIANVFRKWDKHPWNNHILVYFKKDERIDGGWLFGDNTKDPQYYRLAGVCDNFSEFVNLAKPPDFTHVLNLIRKHQLTLKRELP